MAIYGINYKGLHKRKNYEQLFDYLQNNQDMVRYPDRFAKQMRNHPYLTQFDSEEFGYMGAQQKEIKKQDAMTSTIQDQAAQPNAPSTTDLLAQRPPRPPPTGVGQHLNIMGGPQAGPRLIPQNYGDVEVPQPVNQQGSMLINGGPRIAVARRPRAQGDDEIDAPQAYAGSSSSSSSDATESVMRHHRMRERLEQLAEFYLMSDSSSSSSYSSSGFGTIPETDFESVTSALSEQALPQTGITNFTRLPELLAPHFHNLLTPGPGLERYLMQHEDELSRVMQIHDQEMSRSVLDNIYQRALQKISIVRQADQSLIDIGTEIDPGSESGSNKSEEMRQLIDVMLDEGGSASGSGSAVDINTSFKGAQDLIEKYIFGSVYNLIGTTTVINQRKIYGFGKEQFNEILSLTMTFLKDNNTDISLVIGPPNNIKKGYTKFEYARLIHDVALKLNSSVKSLERPKEETEVKTEETKPKPKPKPKHSGPQPKPTAPAKARPAHIPKNIWEQLNTMD
jgi:hypothetical protein